ncbi:MAG: hypothetical protein C0606_07495 [Hyphomicrobiales bacterium]|nr:MAG: hypothetical protein C0606_07495 [Hyphomicrobiales bacterium]
MPNRRQVLELTAASAAAALVPWRAPAARASEGGARHGLSVFGDLAYPPDFAHFAYVNPEAPKGGRLVWTAPSWAYNQNALTFNTLNGFVLKGDAPPRLELLFDSLMVRALDEPDAIYGLLAHSVTASDDGSRYTFHLREEARFHDGTPVTADDVAFSLKLLKEKGHPNIAQTILALENAEADGPHDVTLTFAESRSRDLPLVVAQLPVFSKAYYEANDFSASTLERPLGSGPYRIGRFDVGDFVEYARDPDYWGKDLPTIVGHHNFDVIRIDFYRDSDVAFEGFKKGRLDFREEFSSKKWATGYDFPAVADKRIIRETFPDDRPSGAQGFFLNTRRPHLADPRVREALIYAFDFEWSNTNLFYGLYTRTHSFFQNSDMMASDLPGAGELALLERFEGKVPDEVFREPFSPPTSDGSGRDRAILRHAAGLLREAGYSLEGGVMRRSDGTPLTIEFLEDSPLFERIVLPYIGNLKRLGIEASFRLVDPAQYQLRLKDYDFDVTTRRYTMNATPGEGIRRFWGSAAADAPGSDNLSGIADPVVDALIDIIVNAPTREELTTAARALDRVLRAGRYWVPQWYKPVHTVALWDRFGWPDKKPRYDFPVETTWWYDKQKAERLDSDA